MQAFQIKEAEEKDIAIIISLITDLAVYEKLLHEVIITEAQLHDQLFIKKRSYCYLAYEGTEVVGFSLYFYNFSTFVGKNGLYLEDLYIKPAFRSKGYGKKMLLHLVDIAKANDCGRMEWAVLDWNTPAIDFYKSLGAQAMDDWTVFRIRL